MAGNHGLAAGIPARLTAKEGRKFAFTVGIAFLVLAGIFWWRGHTTPAIVAASPGGALLLAGLIVPGHLGPVYNAWMKLALAISKVTTPIFMGVVFFLVITPIALIAKMAGYRPLAHTGASSWITRDPIQRKSDLERQS